MTAAQARLQVAVVIPTYKRPDLLRRCLEAVAAQYMPAGSYEIVVADDFPMDANRSVVAEMQPAWAMERGRPLISYVPVDGNHGPAAARNRGWRASAAPIIAFTDDDCIPAPDWLRMGLAKFKGDVAAVAGRIEVPLSAQPTDYELDASHLAEAEFATANAFFRRDALDEVGGFDERFTAAWREDSDLFFSVIERGGRVVHADDAVVIHPVRPGPWGVSVRQQQKSAFNALLYKKHPSLYRERVQPSPPWRYYGILTSLVVAAGAVVSGETMVAMAAGGLWGLLTSELCLRRLRGTSKEPAHLAEMAVTSVAIPLLSVFWRLRGAVKYRVAFL